jgi:hypothetical protein
MEYMEAIRANVKRLLEGEFFRETGVGIHPIDTLSH